MYHEPWRKLRLFLMLMWKTFTGEDYCQNFRLWKTFWKTWKNICQKYLCFLKKSFILKSVDEHPHKQVKNYKNTH